MGPTSTSRPVSSRTSRAIALERLAEFDPSAGKTPLALSGLVPAFYQQHAIAIQHDSADALTGRSGEDFTSFRHGSGAPGPAAHAC